MKLQLNDDGTVTIPLHERPPITLGEPSLGQIARMRRLAREADEQLGTVATLDTATASAEQLTEFRKVLLDRTDKMFDGDHSPHGAALIAVIKELSGETITADNLPAWAGSPGTLGAILGHFQTPLPGPESAPTM